MESKVVSLVLAEALVKLPRVTMVQLFELCKEKDAQLSLAPFRIEVAKWLTDGTIPGYETRKGKNGGIYKKGSPNESSSEQSNEVEIDPKPIADMLDAILNNQSHITAGQLYALVSSLLEDVTEAQFKPQLSLWLKNGTIPGYEIKKGPNGGIYRVNTNIDDFTPTLFESEGVEQSEGSFTVEISPTIRIVRSDERNWTIQKKSGETWISRYYHPTIDSALNSVTKHILNGEFKLADSTMLNIKDACKVLKEIEKRIEAHLKEHISINK